MLHKIFKSLIVCLMILFANSVYGMDVTLEWDANTEDCVIGYSVYCRNSKDDNFRHLDDVDGKSNTTITFYGLANDMQWCFVVTAFSVDEESGNSNEACTDNLPSHSGGGGHGCFINSLY